MIDIKNSVPYKYNGARALVLLHEKQIESFIKTWIRAKAAEIKLPETSDPDYNSLNSLLYHVMNSSKYYLSWIYENLELPDPLLEKVPNENTLENVIWEYSAKLFDAWKHPLADISEKRFIDKLYPVRWGTESNIESMLEHAVMHPQRHEYQLNNLLND